MKTKRYLLLALFLVISVSHGFGFETFNLTWTDGDTLNNKEQATWFPSSLTMDFDSLADFTLNFNPWTTYDVGGGNTYSITGILFPHTGEPMAFICFNPATTSPPEPYMKPHSGKKLGCSFSSKPPYNPNNKWLISPKLSLAGSPKIEFWVQTYNISYGLETFNVGVSTSDSNPSHFTLINTTVESAPAVWTRMTYLLDQYANQDVFIGIQCVSDNMFIFMIDDIAITSVVGTGDQNESIGFTIFPNPAADRLSLKFDRFSDEKVSIQLVNPLGEPVRKMTVKPENNQPTFDVSGLSPGIYYLHVTTGKDDFIRKICIMNAL